MHADMHEVFEVDLCPEMRLCGLTIDATTTISHVHAYFFDFCAECKRRILNKFCKCYSNVLLPTYKNTLNVSRKSLWHEIHPTVADDDPLKSL